MRAELQFRMLFASMPKRNWLEVYVSLPVDMDF
jgi:hypothetical protein